MLPDFRVRQRDYLLEIARALTQELDLDKLLGRILNIAIEMLAGQAGMIALRADRGGWHVQVTDGLQNALVKVINTRLHEIPTSLEDPQTVEISAINHILQDITRQATFGLMTGTGLPLIARGRVVGMIFIFRGYLSLFSATDRTLLQSFADQAAIAVQNAQAYELVNEEKQRIAALIDSAADGILILTPRHQIERCNPAMAHLLGRAADSLIGMDHSAAIQWNSPPQGLTLEQAEAGGWPLTAHAFLYVEGDLARTNGQPILPVGVTYAPLLDEHGTLLNIIATVRDITRFRQADELKATFISIMSHELKTPVALIKGYVSTLRRDDVRWEKDIVQDSLAVIEEEADRLTGMIENLLDASRLQAGGISLKRSDVNLAHMAERLVERFKTQTTHHTFLVDFPQDFPVLLVDEDRLQQVLRNLISNAIKYSPEGEIHISGNVRPDDVLISVRDFGPGIAPQDAPFVFDRFYRAPDMARSSKGAGLGLYLTRAIIEAHGGRVWVDTDVRDGTRICFTLPRGVEVV